MAKSTYLALYDYGQGGVWVLMDATSPQEIEDRYPELKVVHERPGPARVLEGAWATATPDNRAALRFYERHGFIPAGFEGWLDPAGVDPLH